MAPVDGTRRSRVVAGVALALALIAVAPRPGAAGPATDTLRPAIDRVLQILADDTLKGPAQTPTRRRALKSVMDDVIDFPDAARRALALHWQARTDAERAEFVPLFKELVTYSYIVTFEAYAGQTVVYTGETQSDGVVSVLTRVEGRRGPPVPVEYRMHQRDGRWLVYDVIVEGVSLVANYRAQFNSIVRTSSYEELMRRIRARVAELTAPPAGPTARRAPLG